VQNTVTVDYVQIPDTYTAVATYTGTGSRTVTVGYITTAQYTGTISKILPGRTVYTAYFIGTPAVPEAEADVKAEPGDEAGITESVQPGEITPIHEAEADPDETKGTEEEQTVGFSLTEEHFPILAAVFAVLGIIGFVILALTKKTPKKRRRKSINVEKID